MPLTMVTTVHDAGRVVSQVKEKLYSLAELKALHEARSPKIDSSAFARACEKMAEFELEWGWWDITLDSDIAMLFGACGITINPAEVEFDLDRRDYFIISPKSDVDAPAFLRALQWYLAGKDIRTLPELQWGGLDKFTPLAAVGTQIRKFDLRSKDARIIREQGLSVQTRNSFYNRSSDAFDFDYYEGLSDQTMADANELMSDLCGEALRLLRAEQEYRYSEEAALESAEANDYRFNSHGRLV